jgi:hypothetical protein
VSRYIVFPSAQFGKGANMVQGHLVQRGASKATSVDPDVRLIKPAPRQPATDVERLVVSKLKGKRVTSLNSLVEAVARDLYVQELANGASVLDIGAFGPSLFSHGVAVEIRAGNGILWSFERPL